MAPHEPMDAVVVGGGQAGISLSYYLQQQRIAHVVLERDRAFSSWRNRWDGFRTNTPNWMNTLPVLDASRLPSNDAARFATRDELVEYFDDCLAAVNPPLRTGVEVRRVVQRESGGWLVHATDRTYEARQVAICNGAMSAPRIPEAAAAIPAAVPQLHSSQYRNPEQIATRSVLLVGSGSSGLQICGLLAQSGRIERIHLAASNVLVLPARLLGIQTHRFLHFLGLFDVRKTSWLGRLMYSGLETRGDPVMRPAPADMARLYGVRLYGKFAGVEGSALRFADGQTLGLDDLTIVWCTGFRGDYAFIEPLDRATAFSDSGYPRHVRGVVAGASGLYFVGLRYQHTVASHDIYGVGRDAQYVADRMWRELSSLSDRRASPQGAR